MRQIELPPAGCPDDSDTEEPETEPSVSTKNLPKIPGYEDAVFKTAFVVPSPTERQVSAGSPPNVDFKGLMTMTEDDVRDALLSWISKHTCYGSGAGQNMYIKNIATTMALHYTLETFTESRSVMYRHIPYESGPVDHPGKEEGAPLAWDIDVKTPELFKKCSFKSEVPKSSTIQTCHTCIGRGWNRCRLCHGAKKIKCNKCGGKGKKKLQSAKQTVYGDCKACNVSGRRTCTRCNGRARVPCFTCEGLKKLRCFIELTSTFVIHTSDYILEETDLPDELVRGVQGDVIFNQTLPKVAPITDSPIGPLNENCIKLTESHNEGFQAEKTLHQRQLLKGVPVTEVHYTWKEKDSRFWVYGKERSIHCPDYPQTCCCGCQIM